MESIQARENAFPGPCGWIKGWCEPYTNVGSPCSPVGTAQCFMCMENPGGFLLNADSALAGLTWSPRFCCQ